MMNNAQIIGDKLVHLRKEWLGQLITPHLLITVTRSKLLQQSNTSRPLLTPRTKLKRRMVVPNTTLLDKAFPDIEVHSLARA